ncbi:hypothetical protein [Paenibacillus qinlingensis]|uniref:Uncharacterized protein n=1 Tax=Paenibacillus qinlingensis TaxID=1837343 RepID=A0ABU1NY37_9BACL|nr:hypothetical protein [Paenibacillus qinlingensis]MDR6552408.1 hypothetical protein [Paenibacillus qinlingensis]
MKKRRSTVLVCPGKDVTLYIPSDTPPEVITYLNQLKAEGMFSHGIMEILTKHILQERSTTMWEIEDAPNHLRATFEDEEHVPALEDQEPSELPDFNSKKNFSLEDIFRQASRNAGKLM